MLKLEQFRFTELRDSAVHLYLHLKLFIKSFRGILFALKEVSKLILKLMLIINISNILLLNPVILI